MRLRHAVLLTSSKSSHPTQLPSRQHIVRITSLDATLTRIGGRGPQLSSEAVSPSWHSPFPLPPIPFFFIALRTLLHNGTGATLFQSISYALFSSRRRVYPHKRLLKKMAFSRPLGIGKSFNDFAPMCECVDQPCSGKNGCEYLAEHVCTFTPSATAMGPTDIPRGKSFLPRRSFVR